MSQQEDLKSIFTFTDFKESTATPFSFQALKDAYNEMQSMVESSMGIPPELIKSKDVSKPIPIEWRKGSDIINRAMAYKPPKTPRNSIPKKGDRDIPLPPPKTSNCPLKRSQGGIRSRLGNIEI